MFLNRRDPITLVRSPTISGRLLFVGLDEFDAGKVVSDVRVVLRAGEPCLNHLRDRPNVRPAVYRSNRPRCSASHDR